MAEPRPMRLEALLDHPPEGLPAYSFFDELEAVHSAIEALRDPGRFVLDILRPQRLAESIHDPLGVAGVEWRYGHMTMRRSAADRAARRRRGNLKELAFDVWRGLLYDDKDAADWFLRSYLGLRAARKRGSGPTQADLREALHHVLERQWADRAMRDVFKNPPAWLDPASPHPERYLKKTIRRDARKLWVKRAKGDEPISARPGGEEVLAELTYREQVRVEREFAAKESMREQGEGERAEREIAEFGLTPREAEVARLAVWGKSNAEIADELGISASTLREHRSNIAAKVSRGAAG